MKLKRRFWLCTAAGLLSASALAHDPSQHTQGSSGPDCSKMSDADMKNMDMNDPVMKAMHEKCKAHNDKDAHAHKGAATQGDHAHGMPDGANAPAQKPANATGSHD